MSLGLRRNGFLVLSAAAFPAGLAKGACRQVGRLFSRILPRACPALREVRAAGRQAQPRPHGRQPPFCWVSDGACSAAGLGRDGGGLLPRATGPPAVLLLPSSCALPCGLCRRPSPKRSDFSTSAPRWEAAGLPRGRRWLRFQLQQQFLPEIPAGFPCLGFPTLPETRPLRLHPGHRGTRQLSLQPHFHSRPPPHALGCPLCWLPSRQCSCHPHKGSQSKTRATHCPGDGANGLRVLAAERLKAAAARWPKAWISPLSFGSFWTLLGCLSVLKSAETSRPLRNVSGQQGQSVDGA